MKKGKAFVFAGWWSMALVMVLGSCKKMLPVDRPAFSLESQFTQDLYQPVLGRTTLMTNNFNAEGSTLPLTFRIINVRTFNDEPAPELLKLFPVEVWKKPYTGEEKTLAEITAKRAMEDHPLFEIREHSGEFIMWNSATSDILKAQPDSGYLFDVEAFNDGGKRIFKNMKLRPFRERPYEPNNQNPITGANSNPAIKPAIVTDMITDSTGSNMSADDISIYFYRKGDGNSLTLRFLDKRLQPMDPDLFKDTKWNELLHGFNMQKTKDAVRYDVAFPIPLVEMPTRYTTFDGKQAKMIFAYSRQGFGNLRQDASFQINFAIYRKGDWEMVIWFNRENPKFIND